MPTTNPERELCPCCNRLLHPRTVKRHLERFQPTLLSWAAQQHTANTAQSEAVDGSNRSTHNLTRADTATTTSKDPGPKMTEPEGFQDDGTLTHSQAGSPDPPVIRRNPPVTVEDWPEPLDEIDYSESDDDEVPADSPDQDPPFVEADGPPAYHPDNEMQFSNGELQRLLEQHLGSMSEAEWFELYSRVLYKKDINVLEVLATRLRTHFSRRTYDDLRFGICADLDLPSEFLAWRRLRVLSGLDTKAYDCCINSCCCYLGKFKNYKACPYCKEARFNSRNQPRRIFHYSPLIPQLQALFQNAEMSKKLRYRVELEAEHDPRRIIDVFNSAHYQKLRKTPVTPGQPYCFFDNPEDIALSLSTDGFTLFKRRRRGLSTAWPIILINNNLSAKIRTRLENVICVGIIPGPRQCKDLNSFLIPLLDELLELEEGVNTMGVSPEGQHYYFTFRAFILHIFGDIPAISKLLFLKGHNAFSPCRTCYIEGCLYQLGRVSVYYVPLTHPEQVAEWDPNALPMRSHVKFLQHFDEIECASTKTAREKLMRHYGINARPIFAHLKSIDLSSCAPYDIMHLFFENLVPNLILHWTGLFKELDEGNGRFRIPGALWSLIGLETAKSLRTIPADFVGTLLDIALDRSLYKAEAYAFWIQYIAPIVLKGRLPEPYYGHMLLLREIIILCLEMEITHSQIDKLEEMIKNWVSQYEEYYYQYSALRLPACPLTIHAILHVPFYLRKTGPLWASWAFVMERFCGYLLPAVKNRLRPYENLDNYIHRRAQMRMVSVIHSLPSLSVTPLSKHRTEEGFELSSREVYYPLCPTIILGIPINKNVRYTDQLQNQLTKYFGPVYPKLSAEQLKNGIDTGSIVRYGRFRMADDGDRIRTSALVADHDTVVRDNSFVRYSLFPDANAAFRNRRDVPVQEVLYGQLHDIYFVVFMEPKKDKDGTEGQDKEGNGQEGHEQEEDEDEGELDEQQRRRKPYLLAFIEPCDTRGLDATDPATPVVKYRRMLTPHIVHIHTIEAVVGRVPQGNSWAIVDRSRNGARTVFVDED